MSAPHTWFGDNVQNRCHYALCYVQFKFVSRPPTDLILRLLALLLLRPLPDFHVRVAAAPLRRHRDDDQPLDRGPIAAVVVVVLALRAKSFLYLSFLLSSTMTPKLRSCSFRLLLRSAFPSCLLSALPLAQPTPTH